MSLNNYLKLV